MKRKGFLAAITGLASMPLFGKVHAKPADKPVNTWLRDAARRSSFGSVLIKPRILHIDKTGTICCDGKQIIKTDVGVDIFGPDGKIISNVNIIRLDLNTGEAQIQYFPHEKGESYWTIITKKLEPYLQDPYGPITCRWDMLSPTIKCTTITVMLKAPLTYKVRK